jgi:ribosome-associated toxin RatA of RatAB toxin-antitoxin module
MRFRALLWVTAVALCSVSASADAPSFDPKSLADTGIVRRYDLDLGGPIRAGGAAGVVGAPASEVRRLVTDYGKYEAWLPGFKRSRIVGRSADRTDVYLEVPIFHGAAKLWAVTRFDAPQAENEGERIDGRMIGPGNVDDLRAVWHIVPVDERHTLVRLELLLVPKLHLGSELITSALAESADDAVSACRRRLEPAPPAP